MLCTLLTIETMSPCNGRGEGQGFAEGNKRATVWAGTGVGLVRKIQPAGEIVEEVREAAKVALQRAKERL